MSEDRRPDPLARLLGFLVGAVGIVGMEVIALLVIAKAVL